MSWMIPVSIPAGFHISRFAEVYLATVREIFAADIEPVGAYQRGTPEPRTTNRNR